MYKQSQKLLSKVALKSLYFALVHPHLIYCSSIYSITSSSNLKRLSLLQKRAIRTITKSSFIAHTSQLFLSQKILPLDKIIIFNKLNFMHTVEYATCPPSFINVWQKIFERNPALNLCNANDYHCPTAKT